MGKPFHVSGDDLKRLQRIGLEMLLEVDRICRKNNIRYSLDGGTLLGAVRHKGYIPWDDDVDIIFLRREYVKFRKACRRDLDTTRFFLQDYQTDPHYRWGYAKLRRNGTSFLRPGQEHLKQRDGVYIDIFVVDNVPDGWLYRRLHHFLCFVVRKGLYSVVGKDSAHSPFMRALYRAMSSVPRDEYFRMRNRLAKPLAKKRTELISHYTFEYPKHCRYGLPRECFDEMIEMEFEGYHFPGFKNYDLYLGTYYGDYMTLPPKEKQVSHLEVSSIRLIEPVLPEKELQ